MINHAILIIWFFFGDPSSFERHHRYDLFREDADRCTEIAEGLRATYEFNGAKVERFTCQNVP